MRRTTPETLPRPKFSVGPRREQAGGGVVEVGRLRRAPPHDPGARRAQGDGRDVAARRAELVGHQRPGGGALGVDPTGVDGGCRVGTAWHQGLTADRDERRIRQIAGARLGRRIRPTGRSRVEDLGRRGHDAGPAASSDDEHLPRGQDGARVVLPPQLHRADQRPTEGGQDRRPRRWSRWSNPRSRR